MAGRPSQPPRDATGEWRARCREFADDLGYRAKDVWYWFDQIASAREFHGLIRQRCVAEDAAWRDVVACLDKRGAIEPS